MTKDTPLSQDDFLQAKAMLDKCIERVGKLAERAEEASLTCCRSDLLDQRDTFDQMAGHLRQAQGSLRMTRALGGSLDGGGIARGGST